MFCAKLAVAKANGNTIKTGVKNFFMQRPQSKKAIEK